MFYFILCFLFLIAGMLSSLMVYILFKILLEEKDSEGLSDEFKE